MDTTEIKNALMREGYTIINEYDDASNEEFPDHTHKTDQKLVVVEGRDRGPNGWQKIFIRSWRYYSISRKNGA